jgi:hypothetical protein
MVTIILKDISFTIPSEKGLQARRAQWSDRALSLPQCANSTASPIKQVRWLKTLADIASDTDGND